MERVLVGLVIFGWIATPMVGVLVVSRCLGKRHRE